jgi:hypothetical protein
MVRLFGLEIYCDTSIMRSHGIPDVETFDQSVAVDTGTAQRDVSGKKIVSSVSQFSRISEKLVKVTVYLTWVTFTQPPHPSLPDRANPALTFLWT